MSITKDSRPAKKGPTSIATAPTGPDSLNGQLHSEAHNTLAVEGQDSPGDQACDSAQGFPVAGGSTSPQATGSPSPKRCAPVGSTTGRSHGPADTHGMSAAADDFPGGHTGHDTQSSTVAGDQASVSAIESSPPIFRAPVRTQVPPAAKREPTSTQAALLADPLLALAADVLDDLEKVRIANENRLRQLTRSVEDSDGETRGFGLDLVNPAASRLAAMVRMMKCDSTVVADLTSEKTPKKQGCCLEHDAERNLTKMLADNPLGPWMDSQKGVGAKQGARLLAAIGDPYIRPDITLEDGTVEASRPRTVSELWAYCGLRPGQKRRRGERSNWSADAKMRAWNIAGSMLKAGNREAYDARKTATEGRLHAEECVRCGPSGKPALPGSPWSDGHRHADGLRVVSKELLKQIWREARRIHLEASAGDQIEAATQDASAASGTESPSPTQSPAPMEAAGTEPIDGEVAA